MTGDDVAARLREVIREAEQLLERADPSKGVDDDHALPPAPAAGAMTTRDVEELVALSDRMTSGLARGMLRAMIRACPDQFLEESKWFRGDGPSAHVLRRPGTYQARPSLRKCPTCGAEPGLPCTAVKGAITLGTERPRFLRQNHPARSKP